MYSISKGNQMAWISAGFNRGLIYNTDGVLVASAAQEGLMRLHEDD